MSNDLVEKVRWAWLGARYRFEKLVKGEPSDEEYRTAKDEAKEAGEFYDNSAAGEALEQAEVVRNDRRLRTTS